MVGEGDRMPCLQGVVAPYVQWRGLRTHEQAALARVALVCGDGGGRSEQDATTQRLCAQITRRQLVVAGVAQTSGPRIDGRGPNSPCL